jgi:HK97 family phage major capsid protein
MEIADFTKTTTAIPLGELTTLAATRSCFGDDVLAAFRTQVELRTHQAQAVLDAATAANRDTLLASEQRLYDAACRERDTVLALQRNVEQRTESRTFVPPSQRTSEAPPRATPASSPVLGTEHRCATWLQQRGSYDYQHEHGADTMRLGALVAAHVTGNRSRLTDLERRALSEGTDSAGGFTVPEVVASRFIDRVRDALVVGKAGAQTVPMSSDTLHIARLAQPGLFLTGAPTINAAVGGWKLENDLIPEAELVLERVTFTAHTLPLLLKMSVELFEDSTNIVEIVESEMAASTANELDRVALVGSGTPPEPLGIKNTPGVLTGTWPATPSDYDWIIDAVAQLWTVNEDPNALITNTPLAVAIAKFKEGVGGQPLTKPMALEGIRLFRTAAAGTNAFLGDFTQLLIGMRTSFRLETSREGAGAFERLQVAVRSYIRADVQVARPKAFNVLTAGVTATTSTAKR